MEMSSFRTDVQLEKRLDAVDSRRRLRMFVQGDHLQSGTSGAEAEGKRFLHLYCLHATP